MLKKMKTIMKKASAGLLTVVAFFALLAMPVLTMAQTGFDTADGEPPSDQPTDVPINGGMVFLIVAGIALATYTLY
ncbi:MAG: hypothetical protein EBZ77_10500, partial [Chitinophagia bacterium]|nr:hypothetical protein [Chitinophagia bacterium]